MKVCFALECFCRPENETKKSVFPELFLSILFSRMLCYNNDRYTSIVEKEIKLKFPAGCEQTLFCVSFSFHL